MRVADDEGTNLAAAVGRLVWNMVVENQWNHRTTAAAAASTAALLQPNCGEMGSLLANGLCIAIPY